MKFVRKTIGRIYNTFIKLYDRLTSKQCEVSVGDIILQRAEFDHCQFLLSSRRLDVSAFVNKGDGTFPYQNTISRAVYGTAHLEERGNKSFAKLIQSYKDKGYDPNSVLTVDKECRLIDGNHRMGVNLFMGIEKLNVRMLNRSSGFPRNLDKYYLLGLNSTFLKEVADEFFRIQKWLMESGNTFCCLLMGEYDKENVSLVSDLELMTHVSKTTLINDSSISLKKGVLVQFSLDFPNYCVKNGKLFSQRAAEIERILNTRKKMIRLNVEIIVSKSCLEGKEIWKSVCEKSVPDNE